MSKALLKLLFICLTTAVNFQYLLANNKDPYKILFNKNSNELRSNYEGKSLYRDDNHLSPYGSLLLYQPFLNFLSSTQE